MIRLPPISTRTYTLFPYTTLVRSAHHLAEMTDEERENALGHWRQLATDVLIAARVTMEADSDVPSSEEHPGRAVVLFEDRSEERRVGKECVSTCRSRG